MLLRPIRVHEKFGGFHISAYEYTKNAPDFTLPNKDTPKTHPVLGLNRRRGVFRGACFCAPTRVRAKFVRFHISAPEYTKNAPDFIHPNKDTPKPRPVLYPNPWRRIFRGVCNTPLHGYMKNLAGFIFPHMTWHETRRVSYSHTRHDAKPGGFWTLPLDMAQNPAGFGLCHSTWRETRQVFNVATRHSAKPGGFLTLPHDMARNPAGFSHCHTFE